jgi:crotonobetainyl-CoA:carnitine CoA-transferase CaiB-like acyl-CoA transferase
LRYDRPPPLLGQHSLEILHELGLDDAEIAELRRAEII